MRGQAWQCGARRWLLPLLAGLALGLPGLAAPLPLSLDSLRQLWRWPEATQVRLLEARATAESGRLAEKLLARQVDVAPAVRQELLMHVIDYYFYNNQPGLAVLRGLECRQLAISRQDSAGRSRVGAVLSYGYSLLEQARPALLYADEALRFAQGRNRGHRVRAYGMMAIAAALAGDHALELRSEQGSLRMARLGHDWANEAICLQNLAQVCLDLHRDTDAQRYLDSAAQKNHVLAPAEREGIPLLYAILAQHQQRPQEAVRLLLPTLQLAQHDNHQYHEMEVLQALIPALEQLSRYREALHYHQRLSLLRDSLREQSTLRQGQELQVIYETERRDRELSQQRQRIAALEAQTQQRASAWRRRGGWLAGMLLLGMMGLAYGTHRRRLARVRREESLRSRIAADLHDDVGTLLTRISMQAELLRDAPPAVAGPALDRLLANTQTAARTMRDIVWGIDPQADTAGALLDRMREYLDHAAAPVGLLTELTVEGLPDETTVSAEARQQLYLIFKEAVTNVVRHAKQATYLRVKVRGEGRQLVLSVWDDGQLQPLRQHSGTGLRTMQQRASAVGGSATAGFDAGGGFRVVARVVL